MTDSIQQPGGPARGRAAVAACLIIAGSVVLGLVAGVIWAAVAPRVVYQVYTLNPPTAYATNPETSAFIAADGWYCLLAVVGGALIGLLGYLFGVRRYGPVPMAAIVVGATGAAFLCAWLGHRQSGGPGFNHLLATSKPGMLLHAPISLGSQGALAFWPLAAAAVAGGIELVGVLRARRQPEYGVVPGRGLSSFRLRADPPEPPPPAAPDRPGMPGSDAGPVKPDDEPRRQAGGADPFGGDPGRAAL